MNEWRNKKNNTRNKSEIVHKEKATASESRNEKSIILKLEQARTRWLTAHFPPHPTRIMLCIQL